MSYGTLKTYEEVAFKFEIQMQETNFIQQKPITISPEIFCFIQKNLQHRRNYISESAICETMISPILNLAADANDLPVWSHVRFDVDEKAGLIGVPDFLIAQASPIGTTFTRPVICVAEAKKENFNEGWAQALSEMIAAQRFNQDEAMSIFGIVSTGSIWQFGKLQGKILTLDVVSYSALENLQKLFNCLHWLFAAAKAR
ncbi:hypothetical protein QUF61_12395 [Candidatus Venteria ishoeyi]|uniref:hypothetical protein n=1 Tax=Candidatus Venteria ishoeyi TaxID=1899563 RepID=UPI0025A66751|nr:hypothetical protein [Candidatus Venteria ishoeyi]MDM8547288.1 hypothetical protein [Candidatus Venteria ishoeyi]